MFVTETEFKFDPFLILLLRIHSARTGVVHVEVTFLLKTTKHFLCCWKFGRMENVGTRTIGKCFYMQKIVSALSQNILRKRKSLILIAIY